MLQCFRVDVFRSLKQPDWLDVFRLDVFRPLTSQIGLMLFV